MACGLSVLPRRRFQTATFHAPILSGVAGTPPINTVTFAFTKTQCTTLFASLKDLTVLDLGVCLKCGELEAQTLLSFSGSDPFSADSNPRTWK
jgi:hypothetical protein